MHEPRLCDNFGNIKIGNHSVHLSFSMPFLRPPNMIPSVDELNIQSEFSLKQIDAPMPEAPWINRCKHHVQFTQKIEDSTTIKFFQKKNYPKAKHDNKDLTVKGRIKDLNINDSPLLSNSDVIFESDKECDHSGCKTNQCEVNYQSDSVKTDSDDESVQLSEDSVGNPTDSLVNLRT